MHVLVLYTRRGYSSHRRGEKMMLKEQDNTILISERRMNVLSYIDEFINP